MIRSPFCGVLLLVLAAVTPAHEDAATVPVATDSQAHALAPAAARFAARWTDAGGRLLNTTEWYLVRTPTILQTVHPQAQTAELWERRDGGEVTLKRIFHAPRRVVEYSGGELRARRMNAAWVTLGSIIDPAMLGQLDRAGVETLPQGDAVAYKGSIGRQHLDILWLEQWSLPAKLVRQEGETTFTLTLQELHADPAADWPAIDHKVVQDYLAIDAADLGDMHYDPFVQQLEHYDMQTHLSGPPAHGHGH